MYQQTISNHSDVEQVSAISGSESVSESSGCNDTLGIKAGEISDFKTGIPFIASEPQKVQTPISGMAPHYYKTWGFNTSLKVPPHESGSVLVSVSVGTIIIPYKKSGNYVYKSANAVRASWMVFLPGQTLMIYKSHMQRSIKKP